MSRDAPKPRGATEVRAALLTALGFITAVGPVAVDFYLPSFTDIGSDLGWRGSGKAFLDGFLPSISCPASRPRNALPCPLR